MLFTVGGQRLAAAHLPFELSLLVYRQSQRRSLHAARQLLADTTSTKPFYVTTPIFYVNAEPHIGHLHSQVLADVLKRFRALRDGHSRPKPVLLTGTDEHGAKIQKAAKAQGVTPIELCTRVSKRFEDLAQAAGVDYDIFYRTSAPKHKAAVQHIWRILQQKGYIYKASYEGWYSTSDEAYYPESQVQDATSESGQQIKIAIESGQPVEWMHEENYMFRLTVFRKRLLSWLTAKPSTVVPRLAYEAVTASLAEDQLTDLSISRPSSRLDWGIRVPDDDSHTIYVWIDALANYLTATGYPDTCGPVIWPADVHIVGKDILRFHAVYWPAMLMALDLPLPGAVVAHAHWTMGNLKMSKSRGNVANPYEAMKKHSKDGIRYFLMQRGRLDVDSDFSETAISRDYRKYLAGQCGNLLQRLQSPKMTEKLRLALSAEASDTKLDLVRDLPERVEAAMTSFNTPLALSAIFDCLAEANTLLASSEPWNTNDPVKLANALPPIVDALARASILLQPFVPDSACQLLDAINVRLNCRSWEDATTCSARRRSQAFLQRVDTVGAAPPVFSALRYQAS